MSIVVYVKKYTETLSVMLKRFRMEYPEYASSKITYAGRLDPLAEGTMLLLTDEDVHRKDEFLGLPKEYEVNIVCGVSTDTYDLLGVPQDFGETTVEETVLKREVENLLRLKTQTYPRYSSRTVEGKPLYQWSREGRLSEISIPEQSIDIKDVSIVSVSSIDGMELLGMVNRVTSEVEGDFRQEEIFNSWKKHIANHQKTEFTTATLCFSVSSGTYIRGLIEGLGKSLNTHACCIKIKRISIGGYTNSCLSSTSKCNASI
jgi:tRNA pseudouridine(55) synthase